MAGAGVSRGAGRGTARVLVALALAAVVALTTTLPAHATDPPWSPAGYDAPEEVVYEIPDEERCSPGTSWTWGDDDSDVRLILVPCTDPAAAAAAAAAQVLFTTDLPEERVLGVERVSWNESEAVALRVWAQDAQIVVLATAATGGRDDALAAGARHAPGLAAALPGDPAAPAVDGNAVQGTLLLIPVAAFLLVVLPARAVVAARQPRYSSTSPDPRWRDVTPATGVVRARRRWRRVGRWLAVIGVALVLAGVGNLVYGVEAPALSLARALLGAAMVTGGVVMVRRNPVHAIERAGLPPSTHGLRAWLGTTLSGAAYVLAAAVVVLLVTAAVLSALLPPSQGAATPAQILQAGPLGVGLALLSLAVLIRDALPVALLGFLLAIALTAGVDVLGRRLRAASLREVLEADTRAPILYLRSFDEDRLTIPTTLHRRGLLAAVSVVRRRRFEEAVVVQLQRAGPVVAIAPPGTRLPRIGAARASYRHDEWQGEVERLADRAAVVVLSATPDSVREGFGWEIDLVADRLDHHRVLVVVGPWRRQLTRRWEAFRSYVARLPFFAGLAQAQLPDGLLVAAHSDRWGWCAWGATRRTDISYAVAIDHALQAFGDEIGGPADPATTALASGGVARRPASSGDDEFDADGEGDGDQQESARGR